MNHVRLLSQKKYIQDLKDNFTDIVNLMINLLKNQNSFWLAVEPYHINEPTLSLTGLGKHYLGFGNQLPIIIFTEKTVSDIHQASRKKFFYKKISAESDLSEKNFKLIINYLFYEQLGYSSIDEIENLLFQNYFKRQLKLNNEEFNNLLINDFVSGVHLYNAYSNLSKTKYENLTSLLNEYKKIKISKEKAESRERYHNIMWNQKITNVENKLEWLNNFDSLEGFEIQCYKKAKALQDIIDEHKTHNNLSNMFLSREKYVEMINSNHHIEEKNIKSMSFWEEQYCISRLDIIIHTLDDMRIPLDQKKEVLKDGLFSFLLINRDNTNQTLLSIKQNEFDECVGNFLMNYDISKNYPQDLEDIFENIEHRLKIFKKLNGLKIKTCAKNCNEDTLFYYLKKNMNLKRGSKRKCDDIYISFFDLESFVGEKSFEEFIEVVSIFLDGNQNQNEELLKKQGLSLTYNLTHEFTRDMYILIHNDNAIKMEDFLMKVNELMSFFTKIQDFIDEKYEFYYESDFNNNNERYQQIFTGLREYFLRKNLGQKQEEVLIKRKKI